MQYRDPLPRDNPHRKVYDVMKTVLGDKLSAVSFTGDRGFVLHAKAPFTAEQIALEKGDSLQGMAYTLFRIGISDQPYPTFDIGKPWTKVVVHGVPLPLWHERATTVRQIDFIVYSMCEANAVPRPLVARANILCPKGDLDRLLRSSTESLQPQVAIQLCISDSTIASRLLQDGIFVFGAHCRVSPYRPRVSSSSSDT